MNEKDIDLRTRAEASAVEEVHKAVSDRVGYGGIHTTNLVEQDEELLEEEEGGRR